MPKNEGQLRAGLHYVGGGRFIPGIPARDLEAHEVTDRSALIASGLYTEADPALPAADERPSADGKETP
jgi:hypothetical protein